MKSVAAIVLSAVLASAATARVEKEPIRGVDPAHPPKKLWGKDQFGWNNCGAHKASKGSKCQNLWINSLDDFCLFAPPHPNSKVGSSEREMVSWCTKAHHGARLIPEGTITAATMTKTSQYIQIKGRGKFTKMNIKAGDQGGELDPWGYDKKGNPIGGVLFAQQDGELKQIVEWNQFIAADSFCIRACYNDGKDPYNQCAHRYDEMGCEFNMPGDNPADTFQTCHGEPDKPAGLYVNKKGHTSTWNQGTKPTPKAHPAAKVSDCKKQKDIKVDHYPKSKVTTAHKGKPTHHKKGKHAHAAAVERDLDL